MILKSISDIGVKRKDNQDNYWSTIAEVNGETTGFVCVCDGMGGLNQGGLASRMVVESIKKAFEKGMPFKELEGVVQQTNGEIFSKSEETGKMGTTCTFVECCNGRYRLFHIGDSRCYRITKRGAFDLLTNDHSAVKERGLSPEKDYAMWKKYKNSLTRAVGVKQRIRMDYREGSYSKGDSFLVCSDGMWHLFEKNCFHFEDLRDLQSLVDKAKREGEQDNITVCMLGC